MRRWLLWVGIAISAVLLYLALRNLKLDEVWDTLKAADIRWVIPGIAAYFVAVLFRTWRWKYLLRPNKVVPVSRLYPVVMIGYMGNNIYPARIGELLRAYVLRRNESVPMPYAISTIFLERVVDGVVMVGFVVFGLRRVPDLSAAATNFVAFAAVLFLIAVIVFFWLALKPHTAERIGHALAEKFVPRRLRPAAMHFVSRFVEGAECLRSPKDLFVIVALTVIAWLIETVKYWFIMQAFNLHLEFTDLMLLNGVANLFTIIPSGPGFVGTFDAAGIGVLTALGVDPTTAAAYTLTLHAVLWLPVTLVGGYFMLRQGLHWADLQRAEQSRPEQAGA